MKFNILNINFIFSFLIIVVFSCNSESDRKMTKEDFEKLKEPLVKVNKYLVDKDYVIIESYVKRRNWNMTLSKSGLWYMIYEQGKGDSVKSGNVVSLAYKIFLLDGTLVYSSDSLGLKNFRVGIGGVEPGLEEGILYLRQGDKARFILQPFLAHGLSGDNNKIPPRSIILYDLEVRELKK